MSPLKSYTETFYEQFPYYIAIGMTPEQYWDGDNTLCKVYRKADKLKRERLNEELWLQGLYVYEAIMDVAPILHAFAKKGTKPNPYPKKPYALTREAMEKEKEEKERAKAEKGVAYMDAFMGSFNKKLDSTGNGS